MTPLMLAASKDDIEMVKLLVEQGKAKIEKPDRYKKTALVHAVMNGASKVKIICIKLTEWVLLIFWYYDFKINIEYLPF